MPTQAQIKTHCPTCGAKLHRQDLSLCAYCATPLSMGDARAAVDDETVKRLARMREHAKYPAAMAFSPRDPEVVEKIARVRLIGGLQIPVAIVLIGVAFWQGGSSPTIAWLAFGGLLLVESAVMMAVVPSLLRRAEAARPMLRRPALVVTRRSEMIDKGKYGTTNYFFTLRFDDGSEGEFRWRGQGTAYEPMSNGATGMAYTSADRLIDFRKL
jgi:hypothetical protein